MAMARMERMILLSSSFKRICGQCRRNLSVALAGKNVEAKENSKKLKAVIGLEVHAQIASSSKLFSGSATQFAAPINDQVAFFDAALPGTLPVLNQRCVEAGILTALALNCKINLVSTFDRKHYFYADLPAGYQITQQRQALANDGHLVYYVKHGKKLKQYQARITQLQLEQDSGKSLHDSDERMSLIDLNRAGMGLMEIVTEPDFSSGEEAAAFIRELHLILSRLGTCSCKMEEGALRVDASVSLHEPGQPLGVRAEVKNINSMRHVAKAIEYEIKRQKRLLENGEEVNNETRSFNSETGQTVAMRDKEKLHDYRFLPEPNLPPLRLCTDKSKSGDGSDSLINTDEVLRKSPPVPEECRRHLMNTHNLSLEEAFILVEENGLQEVFEYLAENCRDPQLVYTFLTSSHLNLSNEFDCDVNQSPVTLEKLKDILTMIQHKDITFETAKKVLRVLFENPHKAPKEVVAENNWGMIQDEQVIVSAIDEIIKDNPEALKQYRSGKKKVEKFFIGKTRAEIGDRVEADLMVSLVLKRINS